MADRTFIESIITVAEGLIKRDISSTERETIIDNFNKSNESTAYKKAIESLEKTLNIKCVSTNIDGDTFNVRF
jgi:hypothetical protein